MVYNRGFIALTSAVIIAAMLLVVVVAGSIAGFYERGVVLDTELKARSREAAESCAQYAYLALESANYTGAAYRLNTLNTIDTCRVGEAAVHEGEAAFAVQGSSGKATTNLRIVYSLRDREVREKEEIPTH